MTQKDFKVEGLSSSNVKLRSNGFAVTLAANGSIASNVSFQLPDSTGTSGQVLTSDGSGNLYFATGSASTSAYVSNTQISNTSLIFESGNGISISGNAESSVITFNTNMSNVTSQTIAVDGSANSFTLVKSVANSHMVLVSYNGLLQDPTQYVVADTTLSVNNTKPLLANSTIEVRYFDFFDFPGITSGGGSSPSYSFQGSTSGYVAGGFGSSNYLLQKIDLSSDTGSSLGSYITNTYGSSGGHSDTHLYTLGGNSPNFTAIKKFPSTNETSISDVGTISATLLAGSNSSESHVYKTFGQSPPPSAASIRAIEKVPFASDTNSVSVGVIGPPSYTGRAGNRGNSSDVKGYSSGGYDTGDNYKNDRYAFPFASDGDATSIDGTTPANQYNATASSSTTHGYTAGGQSSLSGYTSAIFKFPFASSVNSTSIGNLVATNREATGISSTSYGYNVGGRDIPTYAQVNRIEKYPFSSDTNSTDVSELVTTVSTAAHDLMV